MSVDQRALERVGRESKKGVDGGLARAVMGGEIVADDQRLLMGGETADGQGARLTRDAINGARLDAMLSTDMQRGTMLVQMDDGALHQEEERARQKATRRACMGAGARCKVQSARCKVQGRCGPLASRYGVPQQRFSEAGISLAVIEQVARFHDSMASLVGVARRRSLSLLCHMVDAVQDGCHGHGVLAYLTCRDALDVHGHGLVVCWRVHMMSFCPHLSLGALPPPIQQQPVHRHASTWR